MANLVPTDVKRSSIIKQRKNEPKIDFNLRRLGLQYFVENFCSCPHQNDVLTTMFSLFEQPNYLKEYLKEYLNPDLDIVFVGSIERRILFVFGTETHAIAFGEYNLDVLSSNILSKVENFKSVNSLMYKIYHTTSIKSYINSPVIALIALYHPEIFPLPRFSLSISDLIRSARNEGAAEIFAYDMQLGISAEQIAHEIFKIQPDIIGISSTYGQDDILTKIMKLIPENTRKKSLIAFGGSLSALNKDALLNNFPSSVISIGQGEPTITGLIQFHRNEIKIDAISGIAYKNDKGIIQHTLNPSPRETDDMLPELDLLAKTFQASGVMQLESSRGCSYACSFCPRSHKGIWSGDDPIGLLNILPDINRIKSDYPDISPRIFLVDEEFIGYRDSGESEKRVKNVAKIINNFGFSFETNSRADQVYRPHKNKEWHLERISLWRELIDNRLDRCLFGIESGVDSILDRFNKKVSSDQNKIAIRILSLTGVPPRYTYITFDPLMTRDELYASYQFQGRTDLILKYNELLTESDIFDIAVDDHKSQLHTINIPFYSHISYMLVSMECLINSPYSLSAAEHNLLGKKNSSMGSYQSEYLDKDIGLFSEAAQRWIDRNFSFDYLLKSIEKYTHGAAKQCVRELRVILKNFSFDLLGYFLKLWNPSDTRLNIESKKSYSIDIEDASLSFNNATNISEKRYELIQVMDKLFTILIFEVRENFESLKDDFLEREKLLISKKINEWSQIKSWELING